MNQTTTPSHEAQFAQTMRQETLQAAEELLGVAASEDSPGAKALLSLAASSGGSDQIFSLCLELMRAYGICGHGLRADIEAEAQKLSQLRKSHEGLSWAADLYLQEVSLIDINEHLSQDPEALKKARERLEQWVGL